MTASEGGHLNIVKMLIKKHARVDVYDEAGKASLHIAAENGHLDIVEYLLRNGAFINAKKKMGITPLHLAAIKGWSEIAALLVEKFDATVDTMSSAMRTPLHLAAQYVPPPNLVIVGKISELDFKDLSCRTFYSFALYKSFYETIEM